MIQVFVFLYAQFSFYVVYLLLEDLLGCLKFFFMTPVIK